MANHDPKPLLVQSKPEAKSLRGRKVSRVELVSAVQFIPDDHLMRSHLSSDLKHALEMVLEPGVGVVVKVKPKEGGEPVEHIVPLSAIKVLRLGPGD